MEKKRKKFKDTKAGQWLKQNAPDVLHGVSDLLPDAGLLNLVASAVRGKGLDPTKELEFTQILIEEERIAQEAVSRRWEADSRMKYWLPSNVRPLTMVALLVAVFTFITLDSISSVDFDMKESHLELLQYLSMTAFGAYFAGRTWEKSSKK